MTDLDLDPRAAASAFTRTATLRTLAGLEARRYARHPLFLIGVAMMVWVMVLVSKDLAQGTADATMGSVERTIMPAFFLGLLGVFVGVHLTRSMARSTEAVEASPTDGVIRTAALCLACLLPGVVALTWLAWTYVATAVWPVPATAITPGNLAAIRAAGVVAALGGPLLGVMVGRWTHFPGAGVLAVIVLFTWVMLSSAGLAMSASRIGTLARLNAPYVGWVSSDSPTQEDPWFAGGSPWWHLAYLILLCGLAASAAMLHEAQGSQRSRLVRIFVVVAVLALVSLGLAAAPDPTRIPL